MLLGCVFWMCSVILLGCPSGVLAPWGQGPCVLHKDALHRVWAAPTTANLSAKCRELWNCPLPAPGAHIPEGGRRHGRSPHLVLPEAEAGWRKAVWNPQWRQLTPSWGCSRAQSVPTQQKTPKTIAGRRSPNLRTWPGLWGTCFTLSSGLRGPVTFPWKQVHTRRWHSRYLVVIEMY